MCYFNGQDLTNAVWAFAMVGQWDALLFAALAKLAEQPVGDFSAQSVANIAWAFATASQSDVLLFVFLAKAI